LAEKERDAKPTDATMTALSSDPATAGYRNNSNVYIEHSDLAVFSANSMEVDCAHDIFSAFMLGMARNIISLRDNGTSRSIE
jgi:hypothetical protein